LTCDAGQLTVLLGQVAITAGIDYGFATFFTVFLNMTAGYPDTPGHVLVVYAAILVVHGVLNTFGVQIVAFLSDVSAWWHMLGVLLIAVVAQVFCGGDRMGGVHLRALHAP